MHRTHSITCSTHSSTCPSPNGKVLRSVNITCSSCKSKFFQYWHIDCTFAAILTKIKLIDWSHDRTRSKHLWTLSISVQHPDHCNTLSAHHTLFLIIIVFSSKLNDRWEDRCLYIGESCWFLFEASAHLIGEKVWDYQSKMAASSGSWRKHLNKHPIFDVLRANRDDLKKATDSKELLVIKDGELYLWNPYNACILTTNLKPMVQKTEKLTYQVSDGM